MVAVIPGIVFGTAEKCTGSKEKGDLFGLIILYCSVCIGCTSKAVELPLGRFEKLYDSEFCVYFYVIFFSKFGSNVLQS